MQRTHAIRTRYAVSHPFLDLNQEAGDWDRWNALGCMADLRHPDEVGMTRIAQLVDTGLALV